MTASSSSRRQRWRRRLRATGATLSSLFGAARRTRSYGLAPLIAALLLLALLAAALSLAGPLAPFVYPVL
ncbi:MAG: hypothetical protein J0M21_11890 [Xanthomonadales bacterium]|nr:hypothetical protein [Xanthomonadales bacterium]